MKEIKEIHQNLQLLQNLKLLCLKMLLFWMKNRAWKLLFHFLFSFWKGKERKKGNRRKEKRGKKEKEQRLCFLPYTKDNNTKIVCSHKSFYFCHFSFSFFISSFFSFCPLLSFFFIFSSLFLTLFLVTILVSNTYWQLRWDRQKVRQIKKKAKNTKIRGRGRKVERGKKKDFLLFLKFFISIFNFLFHKKVMTSLTVWVHLFHILQMLKIQVQMQILYLL